MDIRNLDARLAVGPQITLSDLAALKAAGFRAVIDNRPDGEEPGQPDHDAVKAAAEAAGLAFRYIPVVHGAPLDTPVAAFARAMDELPGPVFAYCRSGARSTALWTAITPQAQTA